MSETNSLPEGREYAEDFETSDIRQEFCPVDLNSPWYMDVSQSDLPSVYHVARQAIRFARNPMQSDSPGAQRRIPEPGDLKVRWTLARDTREREYVMVFTYLVPCSASIRDEGQLAAYAAPAVNWEKTGWALDDVHPRRYIARVRWLPYPALAAEKSKCFYFFPEPALMLAEPTIGIDRDDLLKATSRASGRQKSIGEKLGGWMPWGTAPVKTVDNVSAESDGDDVSVSDSDSDERAIARLKKKKKKQQKKKSKTGEPPTKKRKLAEMDE